MDKIQARLIAEKFAAGSCSDAEHEAFFQWLAAMPVSESRLLIEEYSMIFETFPVHPARRDLWEKIYQRLDEREESVPDDEASAGGGKLIPVYSRRKWIPAAAAIILIILGAGTYFLLSHKVQRQIALPWQQRFKNDIAPGSNKAILHLANGSAIMLDSARQGIIASQGGTKLVKSDSGKLTYQPIANDQSRTAVEYNTLSTPRGGQYQLILPDGTKVWLNAASSITYPAYFNGNERNVEITGEAYFEVEHNSKMPFHVKVNGMDIEDLGTRFNVNAYADEAIIATSLLEGGLRVTEQGEGQTLNPGQQAEVVAGRRGIHVVEDADMDAAVAWIKGDFQYKATDIKTVMRQVARWYDVEISYEGGNVQQTFYGTIPRSMSAANMFRILEETGGVHFKIEGRKVTVMP